MPVREARHAESEVVDEEGQGGPAVVVGSQAQGEEIVWRAYVYDATTGEKLTQDEVDARGVKVYGEIESDAKAELTYEPHPPGADKTEVYYAGARGSRLRAQRVLN